MPRLRSGMGAGACGPGGHPDRVRNVTIRPERSEFGDLCTWAVGFWPSRRRERRFVT
jgi:hypothetical protein